MTKWFGPQMALGIVDLDKVVLGQMQCFKFPLVVVKNEYDWRMLKYFICLFTSYN
jgi:hypothetical protein